MMERKVVLVRSVVVKCIWCVVGCVYGQGLGVIGAKCDWWWLEEPEWCGAVSE